MLEFPIYIFANCQLETNSQKLKIGDDSKELEPLLYQLLLYFLINPERIISRDELADEVWKQGYVDDNAINRAISELRKVLQVSSGNKDILKTFYKKGYRLQAEIKVDYQYIQQTNSAPPSVDVDSGSIPTLHPSNRLPTEQIQNTQKPYLTIIYTLLVTLLFCMAIWWFTSTAETNNSQTSLPVLKVKKTPITWLKGQEYFPIVSNNGRYLAFSYRNKEQEKWALYIKDTQLDEEFKIIESDSSFFPLSWQKNQLLYQRTNRLASGIWRINMEKANNKHELIHQLENKRAISAAISKDLDILYYTRYTGRGEPISLVGIDLQNKKEFAISTPPPAGLGDYTFQLSPDGKKIVFLRSNNWQNSQVYVYDIGTQTTQLLYESAQIIHNISWNPSGKNIALIDVENLLVSIDVKRSVITKSRLDYPTPLNFVSLISDNKIIVPSGNLYTTDIYKSKSCQAEIGANDATFELIVGSSYKDSTPAFGDQLAFVSNRSGFSQIWLKSKSGKELQISSFTKQAKISGLQWSPNNQNLLGLYDHSLFIFNIKQKSIRFISKLKDIVSPRWALNGNGIYFTRKNSLNWNVWLFDLINASQSKISIMDGTTVALHKDYGLVYTKDGLTSLNIIDENQLEQSLITNINIDNGNGWALIKDVLYFIENGSIKSVNINSNHAPTICSQPIGRVSQLTSGNEHNVYFTLTSQNPLNLVSLEF